jgi:L-asparaginase II
MTFARMVEVWRGPLVESVHHGAAVVANAKGEIIAGWGDTGLITYPRSALKPVQAIALVESGAAAAQGLTSRHIALACASHYGETFQVNMVKEWLAHLALGEDALACGPDAPMGSEPAADAIRAGTPRTRIYNNCSGKHCGMLTVTKHHGWDIEGYQHPDHPMQQAYFDALSELMGRDARSLHWGVDGCTLPAAALSLDLYATMMARFSVAAVTSPVRQSAIRTIHAAMQAHPEYVAGSAQPNVDIARVTGGRIVMKTGAEGYIGAYLPGEGVGVALKIADGAQRARMPALMGVLASAGLLSQDEARQLAHLSETPVRDTAGAIVGRACPCGFDHR